METDAKQALLDSIARYKLLQRRLTQTDEEAQLEMEEQLRLEAARLGLTLTPGPFGSSVPGAPKPGA
jgi:hypothetical protein